MKKILLSLIVAATWFVAGAQELAPDQNPNYKQSLEKYKAAHDNLQTTMNTTVQSTYKAYDFQTAKASKKAERMNLRRNNRMFNNYSNQYYDPYGYNRNNYGRPYQYRNYNGWRW